MKKFITLLAIGVWTISGFSNDVQVQLIPQNDNQQTLLEVGTKDKTVKFNVNGKCGMCKARIEKTALGVKGVSKATWDQKTHDLSLTFNPKKTSVEAVQKEIAKVGHDTGKFKADDKVYNALPGCCHYDRKK